MNFAENLLVRLNTKKMGKEIFFKPQVDSTNTWAHERAKSALAAGDSSIDGAVFAAGCQTAGRGRFGRLWDSPQGENLYMTLLLLRPEILPQNASQLTLVMGLSVAQAANRILGKGAGIKWPNDVVVSGKKICGILTEMQVRNDAAEYILIGTGVNVNRQQFPRELQDKATSLMQQRGQAVSIEETAALILEFFEKNYEEFLKTQNLFGLREAYEGLLLNKGRQVRILEKDGEYEAVAKGITETGELLAEDKTGEIRKIFSGEVSVRGLYSYV